jgi:type IV secretion system protein VirB8
MGKIKLFNLNIVSQMRNFTSRIQVKFSKAKLVHAHKPEGEKTKIVPPEELKPATAELSSSSKKNYFVEARSWADDMYTSAVISRNRYKLAFFIAMGLAVLLTIAVDSLIPIQHLEPLLVNHYQDGSVSVQPIKQPYAPTNQAQAQSELVRYVVNRESYDSTSYYAQYSLINLISDRDVAQQYIKEQSTGNKHSPINVLGNHGFRSVHVDSVVFLDSKLENKGKPKAQQTHYNLAQINFNITDHVKDSAKKKTTALIALVSWDYRGTPSDLDDSWRDWDGFTITRYTVTQRNV